MQEECVVEKAEQEPRREKTGTEKRLARSKRFTLSVNGPFSIDCYKLLSVDEEDKNDCEAIRESPQAEKKTPAMVY